MTANIDKIKAVRIVDSLSKGTPIESVMHLICTTNGMISFKVDVPHKAVLQMILFTNRLWFEHTQGKYGWLCIQYGDAVLAIKSAMPT